MEREVKIEDGDSETEACTLDKKVQWKGYRLFFQT